MDALPYVLDANVLITAKNLYYAFDLAPGFWNNLANLAESGRISSIDYVKGELERCRDQLGDWATNEFANAFKSTDDDDVIESYRQVINWVESQNQFSDAAKADFARGADGHGERNGSRLA
jgi:hypothetical protein